MSAETDVLTVHDHAADKNSPSVPLQEIWRLQLPSPNKGKVMSKTLLPISKTMKIMLRFFNPGRTSLMYVNCGSAIAHHIECYTQSQHFVQAVVAACKISSVILPPFLF
ncbi:hypothetical protein BaRGS_00006819 [Batillaria attramentaria]|uniref:Uncharacterized protein n=1 Tax=Batillaria attramentaria TaxID=370345 RepID=A0ABD0LRJ7_9CAEN